jgi:hypothetical protein
MSGVRIHHTGGLANVGIAVEAVRPYLKGAQALEMCPRCGIPHAFKTVHLNLDNEGDVIVSKEVWAELKDLPGLPFEVANEVAKPPALIIGMNGYKVDETIKHHPFNGRRH